MYVDACETGTGAVLMQPISNDSPSIQHPVCYLSCKLKKHQLSYSTVEKELLGLLNALEKFECYVHGVNPLVIYTDHNPLIFLQKVKHTSDRLHRWSLLLQPYHLVIRHIRGMDNVVADALSRAYCHPT